MVMTNNEIIEALQKSKPYGRVQWGLTYVVPGDLRDAIIAALQKQPKTSRAPRKESPKAIPEIKGKSPE